MEIIGYEAIAERRWLNLCDLVYTDSSGRRRTWQIATRESIPKAVTGQFEQPDAVIIVALHVKQTKIVVTKEYRVTLADYEYGFPAGLVDAGETVVEAARRELAEETGLRMTRVLAAGPPVYSSAGMTDESISMVYVECDGTPSTEGNQGTEVIEVLLVSASEADQLCRNTAIKFDAKAWLAMRYFAACGRIF